MNKNEFIDIKSITDKNLAKCQVDKSANTTEAEEKQRKLRLRQKYEEWLQYDEDPDVQHEREVMDMLLISIRQEAILLKKAWLRYHRPIDLDFHAVRRELRPLKEQKPKLYKEALFVEAFTNEYCKKLLAHKCRKAGISWRVIEDRLCHPFYYLENPADSPLYGRKLSFGGLILTGKDIELQTKLSRCFLNALIDIGVRYEIADMNTFENMFWDLGDSLESTPVILMNDLGVEKDINYVNRVLRRRFEDGMMTVINTRLSIDELKSRYREAPWDGMLERYTMECINENDE